MTIVRVPVDRWIEAEELLVASGPVTLVTLEPVFIVSEAQVHLLESKGIPFEYLNKDSLHAIQKEERRLTTSEREQRGESLRKTAIEYWTKTSRSCKSASV
jgi:hypothetical protein